VEACVTLTKKGLSFEVHVLGEWISDQFRERIFNILRDNGLTNRFVFHGLVHGREKWSILAESQILVLPSIREGQPLVILEALACGIPVVATRVGGIPDTIEHGVNGFLVSPGVPLELAERLEDLITNSELLRKMSAANLQLYKQRFTQEAFLKTQVAWLKACASGKLVPEGQFFTANPELC
jgi:glycosyltransferase involved in cell wall biosynthesis